MLFPKRFRVPINVDRFKPNVRQIAAFDTPESSAPRIAVLRFSLAEDAVKGLAESYPRFRGLGLLAF